MVCSTWSESGVLSVSVNLRKGFPVEVKEVGGGNIGAILRVNFMSSITGLPVGAQFWVGPLKNAGWSVGMSYSA